MAISEQPLLSLVCRGSEQESLGDRVHLLLVSVDHPSLKCGTMRYSLFARGSEGRAAGRRFWHADLQPQQRKKILVTRGLPNLTPSRNEGGCKQTGGMGGNKDLAVPNCKHVVGGCSRWG